MRGDGVSNPRFADPSCEAVMNKDQPKNNFTCYEQPSGATTRNLAITNRSRVSFAHRVTKVSWEGHRYDLNRSPIGHQKCHGLIEHIMIFRRTLVRYVRLRVSRPSVCRLSVTSVRLAQRVELLPACLRAAQPCRHCFYLEDQKCGFRSAGATHCPDKREIWHGEHRVPNFTFIGTVMWEYNPQNCQNFEFWP